jgi:hypothetical protein
MGCFIGLKGKQYTSRSSHSGAKSFRKRNTKRYARQSIHRALRVTRTLDRIRKCFFWPNMRKSVENYIRQCDTYVKRKTPALTASNGTAPLQSLQVSIMLLVPVHRNRGILTSLLVLMDHVTK